MPQKNGSIPRVNQHSSNGTLPSDISISNLVKDDNIINYNIKQYQTYNTNNIKYSMQENVIIHKNQIIFFYRKKI